MIDPETARQAAAAWNHALSYNQSKTAGDALAGLVPQLLSALDDARSERDAYMASYADAVAEKTQLLDQLAHEHEVISAMDTEVADAWDQSQACTVERQLFHDLGTIAAAERDALGERCRQLETALDRIAGGDPEVLHDWYAARDVALAALGDTAAPPEGIEMEYDPKGLDPRPLTDHERELVERARAGAPPKGRPG